MALPQNDHLTRKHLRRVTAEQSPEAAILEQLLVDSVYVFKDDFDLPDLSGYWRTDLDNPFTVDDSFNGKVYGRTKTSDNDNVRLVSSQARWSPERRATLLTRFRLPSLASIHFEMGFASTMIDPMDWQITNGLVTGAAVTTYVSQADAAVFDTDTDTDLRIYSAHRGTTTSASAAQSGPSALVTTSSHSILVATFEGGGSALWLDGVLAGRVEHSPNSSIAAVHGLGAAANDLRDAGTRIWYFLQTRTTSSKDLEIDYVQAWQDREVVSY